jgi:hypothetical protein
MARAYADAHATFALVAGPYTGHLLFFTAVSFYGGASYRTTGHPLERGTLAVTQAVGGEPAARVLPGSRFV